VYWWPPPGTAQFDPDVPVAVSSCYDEGIKTLSVQAPRAAVVMFRAALAEIVAASGSATAQGKKTLFDQLAEMEREGTLHTSLVAWAKQIRVLGNVGAHPNSLGAVSQDEAEDLASLTRQLITVLYEVPARINRAATSRKTTP
jgi:Domain of unknown function (DUF4145)